MTLNKYLPLYILWFTYSFGQSVEGPYYGIAESSGIQLDIATLVDCNLQLQVIGDSTTPDSLISVTTRTQCTPEIDHQNGEQIPNISFQGLQFDGSDPPDPVLAVGLDHLIQLCNGSIGIFTKAGILVYSFTPACWFNNVNPLNSDEARIYDPKIIYDQYYDRWVIIYLNRSVEGDIIDSNYLLSVSQSSDPTGLWWNYKIDGSFFGGTEHENFFPDYPSIGFNSESIIISANNKSID